MDSLLSSVDSQLVLVVAAIAVVLLLFTLLLRVLRVGLGLIVMIVAIVLGLQYFFGISPSQLWYEIGNLPQDVVRLVQHLG
ncbi:hypothetical protein IFO70_20785 [Phormidium tenue FACHB-886]|nr:hypothetical protein [Phormidium tenue FACHB-886]